ncbi:unnamed protein product [Larinioides sclopetarius]|uniref:Uncharacterized protein n=1 Tax=Larinioides sclopetarius TaxID=280406 RepID=A0AAV1Z8H6_9ARAC
MRLFKSIAFQCAIWQGSLMTVLHGSLANKCSFAPVGLTKEREATIPLVSDIKEIDGSQDNAEAPKRLSSAAEL